ncbi:hypothetical protein BJ322DRAFT_1024161 [Thelephora terrestris]|uniref:E3 ubiquitin-protein ligase n=1 Tax=Thelephora terrestris TaxID=56493 RepID=A0A9P6H5K9_9AGAM|nr:hypothetical protein BJ322DRAFT_1024161 [Thelephora terrestris]
MVEELFDVLITIVSEEANATSKMPLPAQVRREIVHALAMRACSYMDLTNRVAERIAEEDCFERVLNETTDFKAPESTADFGMYELKDEGYDEVNPFYFHYARNRREVVEDVLKARLKKKRPSPRNPNSGPVVVPGPWKCDVGPFKNLHIVFGSDFLLQIILQGFHNFLVPTNSTGESLPSAEAILDKVLHLIMLALVNHGPMFSLLEQSGSFPSTTGTSLRRSDVVGKPKTLQTAGGSSEERSVDETVQGPTGEFCDRLQRGKMKKTRRCWTRRILQCHIERALSARRNSTIVKAFGALRLFQPSVLIGKHGTVTTSTQHFLPVFRVTTLVLASTLAYALA